MNIVQNYSRIQAKDKKKSQIFSFMIMLIGGLFTLFNFFYFFDDDTGNFFLFVSFFFFVTGILGFTGDSRCAFITFIVFLSLYIALLVIVSVLSFFLLLISNSCWFCDEPGKCHCGTSTEYKMMLLFGFILFPIAVVILISFTIFYSSRYMRILTI